MKHVIFFSLFITSLVTTANVHAEDLSVPIKNLGDLSQKTASIKAVSHYSGQALSAQVKALTGQSSSVLSPMNVRSTAFLKPKGALLAKGEAFVSLSGPEVHHYYSEYKLKQALFQQTEIGYKNNKRLFANKAVSEQTWLQVSKDYIDSKLEFDEFTHFFELVEGFDDATDTLVLKAPVAGILVYDNFRYLSPNDHIASITPLNSIRIAAKYSLNQTQIPSYISFKACRLAVEFVEKVGTAYLTQIWSEPLKDDCVVTLNETLSIVPNFELNGFLVDKSAVFNLNGKHYIFVQAPQQYTAVAIEIISSRLDQYVVTSNVQLANKIALVSSVSAAQGILLGLGE
jgi:hypothetical protein